MFLLTLTLICEPELLLVHEINILISKNRHTMWAISMTDIFSKEEISGIQKNIWSMTPEAKNALIDMIKKRAKAERSGRERDRNLNGQARRSEQESADIASGKYKVTDFAPGWSKYEWNGAGSVAAKSNADPMLLQQEHNLKKMQNQQLPARKTPNRFWQNQVASSPSSGLNFGKTGPDNETVRTNSKWQDYYIDWNWNAVIVTNQQTNLQKALETM